MQFVATELLNREALPDDLRDALDVEINRQREQGLLKSHRRETCTCEDCLAAMEEDAMRYSFHKKLDLAEKYSVTLLQDTPTARPSVLVDRAFELASEMVERIDIERRVYVSSFERHPKPSE